MGKYNFDEIVNRSNTNSMNVEGWRTYIFGEGFNKEFPYKDEEFIRMWIADMDFAVAPEICDGIKERVDQRIFGYTKLFSDDFYNAFNRWCEERYGWSFPKEELVISTGVVPTLFQVVEDLVGEDEKILFVTPSYGPFKTSALFNNVGYVESPLIIKNGEYLIDFEDLESKLSDPKVKLLIFCNPHNPTGKIWTEEELNGVSELVQKYNKWIISDEIHCDLLRTGKGHIPMGKIMQDYKKLITCMSASKTFNIAGLLQSNIIIRDEAERERFMGRDKNSNFYNPLSVAAHLSAYEKGGEWLEELKEYLDGNFSALKEFLDEYLPETKYKVPDSTYLAWVNMNPYLAEIEDHTEFFAEKAGVLLEGGDKLFAGNAKGYIRLNLAMPREVLKVGLERIKEAIYEYNGIPL